MNSVKEKAPLLTGALSEDLKEKELKLVSHVSPSKSIEINEFAKAWLFSNDLIVAARRIRPNESSFSELFKVASDFQLRVDVLTERQRLLDIHGARHFLPSRVDFLHRLYKLATDYVTPHGIAVKAHELYFKINGSPEATSPVDYHSAIWLWQGAIQKSNLKEQYAYLKLFAQSCGYCRKSSKRRAK